MVPKKGSPTAEFGCPKRGWLSALNISALHHVGANVGVQHVAKHYTSRSCTGRSSTSSMKLEEATADSARGPIKGSRGQDHLAPLFSNEHLPRSELKLFGQADGLTTIVHENLRLALHRCSLDLGVYECYMPRLDRNAIVFCTRRELFPGRGAMIVSEQSLARDMAISPGNIRDNPAMRLPCSR